MYRGKVTAVDANGVYVLTAEYGTLGPCQAVVANYYVGSMVLCVNVGDEASPELVVIGELSEAGKLAVSSTGNADLIVGGPAGHWRSLYFKDTNSNGEYRFVLGITNGAETGSDAGSDFYLSRWGDGWSDKGFPLKINRATGKWTFGDVGPTAGLEMGSGGPTWTVGTGAPSHSAPNGSLHSRTDGGSGTTLYVRESGSWVGK